MDLNQLTAKAEQLADQVIAERARYDLFYLCRYILGYEDLTPKTHGPLCAKVRHLLFKKNPGAAAQYTYPSDWGREDSEGMPTEEEKKAFWEEQRKFEPDLEAAHASEDNFSIDLTALLLLMPRGTLKSSVVTIGFTLQWHLNWREDRVLLDSETFTKSKAFLTEIKGHHEDNEKYRDVFLTIHGIYPDARKRRDIWSTEAINLACRSRKRKEPSIDCAGIDVTKNGMHYDLAIMDDLHSEKNTKNVEQINQVKEHYRLVYSLLDPGAASVVIGTRWDYNDTYQMIIDEEFEDFNFMTRAAEAEDGSLFFPERLDHKQLEKMRRKQKSYLFSCQYMNNPVDNDDATFKREYFEYISEDEALKRRINWYGLVDPSYEGPYSDYVAIVIAGMDAKKNIYVRYIERKKMTYSQIIQRMFVLNGLYRPVRWGLEVVATQKSIEHALRQEELKRHTSLKCHLFKSRSRTKTDRIEGLAPFYEMHQVFHISGCSQLDVLENELIKFPKAKNDDVSDCLSDILEIGIPPTDDVVDEQTRKKRKRYVQMLNKPRSPMVGY